jgi:hypothetical protein
MEKREKPQPRKQYSPDEMPPDPTPGDPGRDARNQQWLERQRAAERERSEQDSNKPGPQST